jgi:hypothetical protein
LILEDDRNAMQRSHRTQSFIRGIETIGFRQRGGIDRDDRIDLRAFFVESLDAIEIHLH